MLEIHQFPILAMKNRHLVEQFTKAGCFTCCKIMNVTEISEYTDDEKTILCPFCKTDSVIADVENNLTEDLLKKANQYLYF